MGSPDEREYKYAPDVLSTINVHLPGDKSLFLALHVLLRQLMLHRRTAVPKKLASMWQASL